MPANRNFICYKNNKEFLIKKFFIDVKMLYLAPFKLRAHLLYLQSILIGLRQQKDQQVQSLQLLLLCGELCKHTQKC